MAEEVILVDVDDNQVGTMEKMEAHLKGILHRAFSVFIFSSDGKMLLQRRAFEKYHSGGLFTNACCSHPRPGEATLDAAHRRLQEELGFDCDVQFLFPLVYRAELDAGLTENEYDHVFYGVYDGPVQFNPEEVHDIQWITPDELTKKMKDNPDEFTIWFQLAVPKVLDNFRSGAIS